MNNFKNRTGINLKRFTLSVFICAALLCGAQTSYTFTAAGATGSVGPNQTQLNAAYASTNLNGLVTAGSTGIQSFVVPQSGLYQIEVVGASGGNRTNSPNYSGGLGAYISGEFNLTQGDVLRILVGQKGVDGLNTASGGGGTFVEINNTIAIVAGAGGGATGDNNAANGSTLTTGTNDFPGGLTPGGSGGAGGQVCNSGGSNHGGGGGGYTGNGATSTQNNAAGGGLSFTNGGTGGASAVPGAFGGGGGATMSGVGLYGGGGGGGGYSGGAGGQQVNYCTPGIDRSGGGGGGSYNSGTNQIATEGTNPGDGYVIVRELCNVDATTLTNPICEGETVVLNTNALSDISWSSGGTGSTETVTPIGTTSYSVTGNGPNNCTATAVISITVNPLPVLSPVKTPSVLCSGNAATLSALGASGYTWEPGMIVQQTATVNPISTTVYTLSGENFHGCVKSETIEVVVDNSLLSVSSDTSICEGAAAYLTASGVNSYYWSNAAAFQNILVHPSVTTVYSVYGENLHGCNFSNSVLVTVMPVPTVTASAEKTMVCLGETVSLNASGASTYSWNHGGTGAQSTHVPPLDIPAEYIVTGTAANGCSSSASVMVDVQACTGIAETIDPHEKILVFPNPTKGPFSILSFTGQKQITVSDLAGRILFSTATEEERVQLDLSHLSAGLYYVTVNKSVIKVIKE